MAHSSSGAEAPPQTPIVVDSHGTLGYSGRGDRVERGETDSLYTMQPVYLTNGQSIVGSVVGNFQR